MVGAGGRPPWLVSKVSSRLLLNLEHSRPSSGCSPGRAEPRHLLKCSNSGEAGARIHILFPGPVWSVPRDRRLILGLILSICGSHITCALSFPHFSSQGPAWDGKNSSARHPSSVHPTSGPCPSLGGLGEGPRHPPESMFASPGEHQLSRVSSQHVHGKQTLRRAHKPGGRGRR